MQTFSMGAVKACACPFLFLFGYALRKEFLTFEGQNAKALAALVRTCLVRRRPATARHKVRYYG